MVACQRMSFTRAKYKTRRECKEGNGNRRMSSWMLWRLTRTTRPIVHTCCAATAWRLYALLCAQGTR